MTRLFAYTVLSALVLGAMFTGTAQAVVQTGQSIVVERGQTVDEAVAIGGSVIVNGTVTGDAVAVGGSIVVGNGAEIGGDAVAIGGGMDLKSGARIKGDVVSVIGGLHVAPWAVINGDAVTVLGGTTVLDGAKIKGDVVTIVGRQHIDNGIISGEKFNVGRNILWVIFGGLALFLVIRMVFLLVVTVIITLLAPAQVRRVANCVRIDTGRAFLVGLGLMALVPLTFLIGIVPFIGPPLIPLTLFAIWAISLFGAAGVCLALGRRLSGNPSRSDAGLVLLGVVAIGLVRLIPLVGFIVWVTVTALSLGSVLLVVLDLRRTS